MNVATQQKLIDEYQARKAKAEDTAKKHDISVQESLDGNPSEFDFPKAETVYALDGRALWVHERSDRPGTVRVRWQSTDDEVRLGVPRRPKLTLDLTERIRDDRGRLRKRNWARATEKAKEAYENATTPETEDLTSRKLHNLDEVLRYFLDPETGKSMTADWRASVGDFPIDPDRTTHLVEIYRYIDPESIAPDQWHIEHARKIWRGIERERGDGSGARWAEQVVSTVHAACNYAAENGRIDAGGGLPKKWRKTLKSDWAKRTGVSTDPTQESYEVDEARKLISNLAGDPDETNRLTLTLGAGFRSGQVARYAQRSGLRDEGPFGKRLVFYDRKAEKDVIIDLAPRQQRELRYAMEEGFLSELEQAYQAGEIGDYYLIAGGRRKNGKAQVKHAGASLHKRQVRRRFREYEERCGVEHKDGRLFHGLRRALEELIGEETTDDKVRDAAQGWTIGGGTRAAIYANKKSERTLEKAAIARATAIEKISSEQTSAERVEEVMLAAERLHRDLQDIADDLNEEALGAALDGAAAWVQTLKETAERLAGSDSGEGQEDEAV